MKTTNITSEFPKNRAGGVGGKLPSGGRWLGTAFLVLLATPAVEAKLTLPAIFSDHMVLQCEVEAPVWGWADPGEAIEVSIAGQAKRTLADEAGQWRVKLDPIAAGTVSTLQVRGKDVLDVADVLVGEVWLCSGQSNMAAPVKAAWGYEAEKAASDLPQIRMFSGQGKWKVCSPQTLESFAAVPYFFGRELHQKLERPVGLINSSVGGTPIQAWTSLEVQRQRPELKPLLDDCAQRQAAFSPDAAATEHEKAMAAHKEAVAKAAAEGKPAPPAPKRETGPRCSAHKVGQPFPCDNHWPGVLFENKIQKLIPYGIRGAIWYQGESNAFTEEEGRLYGLQLPLLIADWRARWGQGDFPFAWVQLPNYFDAERFHGWCHVRESMSKALSEPNTGMIVALDVGESRNLHPRNKQEVGRRLSNWAMAKVYKQDAPCDYPIFADHEIIGPEIVCSFQGATGGLKAKEGSLTGFTLSGSDHKWVDAEARIEGTKVIVSAPGIIVPVAVRYAWAIDPRANLINGLGLPASPFRSDDW